MAPAPLLVLLGTCSLGAQEALPKRLSMDSPGSLRIDGTQDYGRFGHALACGDLNGDAIPDLVVSAPFQDSVFVFFGSRGLWRDPRTRSSEEADVGLQGARGELLGSALAAADSDRDGYWDLGVGAPGVQRKIAPQATGRVHYLRGRAGWERRLRLDGRSPLLAESSANSALGVSLLFTDVNQDGTLDLLVGAPGLSHRERWDAGAVYTVLLGPGDSDPTVLEGPRGPLPGGRFGTSLAASRTAPFAVLAGAPGGPGARGRVYLLRDPGHFVQPPQVSDPPAFLEGEAGDRLGMSLATMQSGGKTVALAGAPGNNRVYVLEVAGDGFGKFRMIYEGTPGIDRITYLAASLGWSLASPNQGRAERMQFVAGAPQSNKVLYISQAADAAGTVALPERAAAEIAAPFHDLQVVHAPDAYGYALCACDLDGDGQHDLFVSAPGADNTRLGRPQTGSVFGYSGSRIFEKDD